MAPRRRMMLQLTSLVDLLFIVMFLQYMELQDASGQQLAAESARRKLAETARVGFPEIRLACFPPGAAALLPLRIGEARAADWILTGKSVSGRQAAEAGFAAVSVAADRLGAEVDRLAERMLGTSPSALSAVLPLLRRARRAALTHPLADAENAYRALAGNEDLARAVREFGAGRGRGR